MWRTWLAALLCVWVGVSAAAIEVTDAQGARVRLDRPAQRIVSLSPHATELVAFAGAAANLVAVTQSCDWPAQVSALPRVSNVQGVNIEALIAAKPDLVIAWPSGNRPQDIERIRALGIAVFASEPQSVARMAQEIESLGQLVGTQAEARTQARQLTARMQAMGPIQNGSASRVFYQLGAGALYTLNDKHLVMEIISRCGGRNIFGALSQPAPLVSAEAVLAAKPEVIVIANVRDAKVVREHWSGYQATRNARVVEADGQMLHRPSPRMLDAAAQLCAALHRSQ